ncbi:MAG: hypothetical protein HOG57_01020, partial [Nitrosopumilus sp.]|nr:hypothetical protein [Nitrosopumilus sp.]
NKIPIKIVELSSPSGQTAIDVMIDVYDFEGIENPQQKIKEFKEKYFELVKKAKNIMPDKKEEKIPSVYWKIGDLFKKFSDSTTNRFEITNYNEALERDFGLSSRYVHELIIFATLFKKNEIQNSISMSIYRAFVWKKNQLEEIGELKNEKLRLVKRAKNNESIKREDYKTELNKLVKLKSRGT